MSTSVIDQEIANRLSGKLGALEQLRALLQGNDEVSIPGVVVAGAQSAGKSSVLEALGGFKLPRGQNITTRCPLVLSLVAVAGAEPQAVIGGTADLSTSGKEIIIDAISDNIEKLTTELAGDGTAVSAQPIYLKIIRPSGPTLTLIDLPGITHVSKDGQDIHTETVNLVKKYIENENMVILVVIPAMDDFHNAEAVSLAQTYDQEGRRTLGVVTKTDNVQAGCPIKSKLRMEVGHVQLSLGFIAVVNRTPIEVEEDTPAEYVRARERQFFTTNPEVAGLEKEYWGLDTLAERIVNVQAERVEEFIPKFLAESKRRTKELRKDRDAMPKVISNDSELWEAFYKVTSAIGVELKEMLMGGSDGIITGKDDTSINVIPHVTEMYEKYATEIRKEVVPDFCSDEYHKKARDTYARVKGVTLTNLLASRVFGALFREVFSENLSDRSEKLVEHVKGFMQKTLDTLCERACANYPTLTTELKTNLIEEFIDWKETATKSAVNNTLRAEIGWVFTQDRSYKETMQKVSSMVDNVRNSKVAYDATVNHPSARLPLKQSESVGCVSRDFITAMAGCSATSYENSIYDLQVTIHAYSDLVCRRLFDSVPKVVHLFLVDEICDGFVPWLLGKVDASSLKKWLAEDSRSQRRRKEIVTKLSQFEEAMVILKSVDGSSK